MKRRRGLSGTPEQHAAVAAQFGKRFRSDVRSVKRFIAAGDCTMALNAFRHAAADATGYATNRVGAKSRARTYSGALAISRRMQEQLTDLEDKLQWCSWRKYRKGR